MVNIHWICIYKYDIIDNLKNNGILLLNTSLSKENLYKTLPNKVKKLISLLNYEDTNKFVNELLELDSSLEIEKKLDEFAKKNFGKYY